MSAALRSARARPPAQRFTLNDIPLMSAADLPGPPIRAVEVRQGVSGVPRTLPRAPPARFRERAVSAPFVGG